MAKGIQELISESSLPEGLNGLLVEAAQHRKSVLEIGSNAVTAATHAMHPDLIQGPAAGV